MDDGPITPAPWALRYDGLILLLAARSRAAASPGLAGWLSAVALVDYASSPVGPYRELLHIDRVLRWPGFVGPSVRDIWVDSAASARSGNANWGLTKSVIAIDRLEAGGTHRWRATDGEPSGTPMIDGVPSGPGAFGKASVTGEAGGTLLADIRHRPFGPPLPVIKPKWLGTLLRHREGRVFQTPVSAQALVRPTRVTDATLHPKLVVDLDRHRIVAAVAVSHGRMGFHVPKITSLE